MGSINVRRSLVSAAVAAAFGVAGGPADAVFVVGEFDPLSFFGVAPQGFTLHVDNDCLSITGFRGNAGTNNFTAGDGICNVALLSASAHVNNNFYQGDLTFAPPALFDNYTIFGVNVVSGPNGPTIDSFDTAVIPFVTANPYTFDSWGIQFRSGRLCNNYPNFDPYCNIGGPTANNAGNPAGPNAGNGPNPLPKAVYLYHTDFTSGNPFDQAQYLNLRVIPENGVPEPGTLGLILGALGGGWLARRRKKPKPAD